MILKKVSKSNMTKMKIEKMTRNDSFQPCGKNFPLQQNIAVKKDR